MYFNSSGYIYIVGGNASQIYKLEITYQKDPVQLILVHWQLFEVNNTTAGFLSSNTYIITYQSDQPMFHRQ